MTDNEIIKALECCSVVRSICCQTDKCPYSQFEYCESKINADALDLIKRQQAEIDRLKVLFNDQQEIIADLEWTVENEGFKHLGKMYSELRAEAIKEFANKLKTWHCYERYDIAGHKGRHIAISEVSLNNLVKEMGCGE